jgi:hypothetical protein
MDTVEKIYLEHYKNERYLRNTAPMVRVGMVYSEQTEKNYGGKAWQQKTDDHAYGMYHALIEDRMPFEMINSQMLDAENLKPYKLLILPNIAAMSDAQCEQLRKFVESGGSIVATFETSLYDEEGKQRADFGLKDLFGVSFDKGVEGPMRNSYLRLKADTATNKFHPVLKGLEDAYRIINTVHRVKVNPQTNFPSPVTLIPTYPDLPMEDVYLREPETDIRELYLREVGKGRIAYIPGDMDRTFWQLMSTDHGKLLRNTIRWALNEDPVVDVKGSGIVDVTVWRQKSSMTVHLVNLTNPMMMKGPFRELIPIDAQQVSIKIPRETKVSAAHLLISGQKPAFKLNGSTLTLTVPNILDHEIVALDLA